MDMETMPTSAFAEDLAARFKIAGTEFCGAEGLIELAFDNLMIHAGRDGWSPGEFARSLADALQAEGLLPDDVSLSELIAAIQTEAVSVSARWLD